MVYRMRAGIGMLLTGLVGPGWGGLMTIAELQKLIESMYAHKDRPRGSAPTFMWFMEEVGELAAALAEPAEHEALAAEFADVIAWLVTLANIEQVDLSAALEAKYGRGCPGCGLMVCTCRTKEGRFPSSQPTESNS